MSTKYMITWNERVVPVMDAVRVELEAIAFRDGLKSK
jgi:hypothetical protein